MPSRRSASKSVLKKKSSASKAVLKKEPTEVKEGKTLSVSGEVSRELVQITQGSLHIGPLPPAREFAAYNKGVKNAAERILRMAESNQSSNISERKRMQVFAFILLLCLLSVFTVVELYATNMYAIIALIGLGGVVLCYVSLYTKSDNKR